MVAIPRAEELWNSASLVKRWDECDQYGNCISTWGNWGRWVALVIILVCLGILLVGCSILSARRRRESGLQPYYGTAWVLAKHPNNGQYNPHGGPEYYGQPAPPYSPPTGGYFQPQQTGMTNSSAGGPNQYEMHGYQSVPFNGQQQHQTGPTHYGEVNPYYTPSNGPPLASGAGLVNPPPAHTAPEKQ